MFYPLFSSPNPQLLTRPWWCFPPLSLRRSLSSPTRPSVAFFVDSVRNLAAGGRISEALLAYSSLRHLFPAPHVFLHPISSLLASSTKLRALPFGLHLHAHLISLGFHAHSALLSRLVAFYAGCGELREAQALVEGFSCRDSFPWNILISTHVKVGFPGQALLLHIVSAKRGIPIDGFSCSSILKACGETLNLLHTRMLHAEMLKTGVHALDLFLHNALVSVYSKCGDISAAEKVFDEMPQKDVISWNAMISGYISLGRWENARQLLENMRSRVAINTVTWNTIICGNLQMGNYIEALQLVSQMKKIGSPLDAVTIVISLSTCSKLGCLKLGKEIHASAVRSSLDHQEPVTNSLITMYSRCDRIGFAEIVFNNCKNKSSVTWSCIIAGNARADRHEEASLMFQAMLQQTRCPTQAAILSLLPLYGRLGNLRHGKELHCYITKMASCSSISLWNALIFMYCRSRMVSEAWKVFMSMGEKDRVSYTSMICGFGMEGEGQRALTLFRAMSWQGLTLDHVAITAALSACCRTGLLTEARWIFENMTRLCGVVPRPEHYSCMVNLYVRAGYLGRAEELLHCSTAQPAAATSAI